MAENELDVLRAAIVFTSSGLDASMKRLVRDVGTHLVSKKGTAARGRYEAFLRDEIKDATNPGRIHAAMLHADPSSELVSYYIEIQVKASFQGSADLKRRVRDALGIGSGRIADSRLEQLDGFFVARNAIVHELDYTSPNTNQIGRRHRNPNEVAGICSEVFEVSAELVTVAAERLKA
jgi:hypothetical protein